MSAFAQSNLATISGVITDPSEKTIAAAEIRLRNAETGATRNVTTSSVGHFEASGLTPGEYAAEIRAQGFAAANRSIRLEVGQNLRLDVRLTIGEANTSVDVMALAETLKTEDAAIG
ncbi:MAG TPA: carboxypeptidase-like regulatory domain-containing protein, partial [Bryobacteraceae bacterium]|nr:carboxypeptidase-like regulatory domain-containing protein [Bryobacteraceae bacterium]